MCSTCNATVDDDEITGKCMERALSGSNFCEWHSVEYELQEEESREKDLTHKLDIVDALIRQLKTEKNSKSAVSKLLEEHMTLSAEIKTAIVTAHSLAKKLESLKAPKILQQKKSP